MNRTVFSLFCIVLLALFINGCATKRIEQDRLYARLVEKPEALDWSVLEDRTIVIDPGHGGRFDGAIGLDSLREADANLGVALYLWGLLEQAGADVHLTRTTDRDFASADSIDLREDLELRSEAANAFEPEAFISIHHNSNLELDRKRNRLEIYYRSTDHGASLELARDIHTHLARNLGIGDSKIEPGSYFVLRNSTARASILGEASYISNPSVEDKLKLSAKQKLEAEAYFLGLITYFSRGVPIVERIGPASDTLQSPEAIVFKVKRGAGVPIDPATASIRIGSSHYEPLFDPVRSTLACALGSDLPNGEYEIACAVRSAKGATGSSRPYTILLSRPAHYVLPLPPEMMVGGSISIVLKVLDERGSPVADGTPVTICTAGSENVLGSRCRNGLVKIEVDSALATLSHIVELPGLIDTLFFPAPREGFRPIIVIDTGTRTAVSGAQAFAFSGADSLSTAKGDSKGILRLPGEPKDRLWLISAQGYRPVLFGRATGEMVGMHPQFGGYLRDLRIAIDPAGGGSDHGGLGKRKARGSSLNLEVAKHLGQILERTGARVLLTRMGEETVSIEERVFKTNRFSADLALRFVLEQEGAADGPGCTLMHYPGSRKGEALAASLASALSGLPPCEDWNIAASASRFLQQTSCPAVEIRNSTIESDEAETMFSNPLYAGLEAERVLSGLLIHASGDAIELVEQSILILRGGEPVVGAAVTIDQTLTHYTGRDGIAHFSCLEPGEHLMLIELPGRISPLQIRNISVGGEPTITVSVP
jgi:N-acetylmuramoyl-L-alanine amidase